jgi:oligo-alginate lyase
LWRRAVDGPYGIRKQIEHGVTSEYLWFEQSMGYNSYVVSALLPLFTLAAIEGRDGELREEMHAIQNMMLAPIMMRFPGNRLPNPADATGGAPRAPNERLLGGAYRVFPTALGLRFAASERSWDTLIDPPPPAPAAAPLPETPARSLTSSRMAILRGGPWQVYFHYGQIHASHAQAEALNFEAFHGTVDITHDPGTVGYGSPLHTGFYRTGAAHNVPLVNGEGQARWQPGELISFSPTHAVARQPEYRPGVAAARDLRIDGARLIDTVTLELAGAAPQRLGTALHLQGRVRVPEVAEAVEPPLPYWRETRRAAFRDRASIDVEFQGLVLRVTIETAGPFTITFGRSPDMPPGVRDSVYVETEGVKAQFRTTFEAVP